MGVLLSCMSKSAQHPDTVRLQHVQSECDKMSKHLYKQQVFLEQYILSDQSVSTICSEIDRPVWMTAAGETEHVKLIVQRLRQVLREQDAGKSTVHA